MPSCQHELVDTLRCVCWTDYLDPSWYPKWGDFLYFKPSHIHLFPNLQWPTRLHRSFCLLHYIPHTSLSLSFDTLWCFLPPTCSRSISTISSKPRKDRATRWLRRHVTVGVCPMLFLAGKNSSRHKLCRLGFREYIVVYRAFAWYNNGLYTNIRTQQKPMERCAKSEKTEVWREPLSYDVVFNGWRIAYGY